MLSSQFGQPGQEQGMLNSVELNDFARLAPN